MSGCGRSSMSSSMTKPFARSSRIQSPWPRWNSTVGSLGPLEAMHPEVVAKQSIRGRDIVLVGCTEHEQRAVAEEDELAARPQQAGSLGDPGIRVGPDRGAVLADHQVERAGAERDMLAGRTDERERRARSRLAGCERSRAGWASGRRRRAGRRAVRATRTRTRCRTRARPWRCRRDVVGSRPTSDSGIPKMPHVGSASAHSRCASATCSSRRADHHSTLAPRCSSGSAIRATVPVRRARRECARGATRGVALRGRARRPR